MKDLEAQIKHKVEIHKKSGRQLESTCRVCLKTKFADGVGHQVNLFLNTQLAAVFGGCQNFGSYLVGKTTRFG